MTDTYMTHTNPDAYDTLDTYGAYASHKVYNASIDECRLKISPKRKHSTSNNSLLSDTTYAAISSGRRRVSKECNSSFETDSEAQNQTIIRIQDEIDTIPVIEIRGLDFAYSADPVLRDVNLTVQPGEFITIVGENGSGKSTLLKLIIGALRHSGDAISLWGNSPQSEKAMRHLAYVPQNMAIRNIGFPITCREMVAQALQRDFRFFKIPRRKHYRAAEQKLREMGLGNYLKTPLKELSGGFQQRVMICRALMTNPDLLVLDEPTAGIDQVGKENFIQLIANLNRELGTTIILVTHEFDVIRELENPPDIYRIKEGRLTHAAI